MAGFDLGGFLGLFSNIVGAVGSVSSLANSYNQNANVNDLIESGQAASGEAAQAMNMQKQYAAQLASASGTMVDQTSLAETMGIFRALLSGAEPVQLATFRSQFEEIEYNTQAQIRDIDKQARTARTQIADTVPDSGLKMRMLADVALKTQDLKAAVTKTARDNIRDTNIKLKNEYMGKALEFGKSQPEQYRALLGAAGNTLTGQANQGVGGNTALIASTNLANQSGEQLQTLGESIGRLATRTSSSVPQVTTTGGGLTDSYQAGGPSSESRFIGRQYNSDTEWPY